MESKNLIFWHRRLKTLNNVHQRSNTILFCRNSTSIIFFSETYDYNISPAMFIHTLHASLQHRPILYENLQKDFSENIFFM